MQYEKENTMNHITDTNYFELFGLVPRFSIDLNSLELTFRKLQSDAHPDRHTSNTQAEQLIALQQSTLINDAYQMLRNPSSRAQCLINLAGKAESSPALSPKFLMAQMEWREAIEEACVARDVLALEALSKRLNHRVKLQVQELASDLDEHSDFESADLRVNELRFYEKLRVEIDDALDLLGS
jgi:molecular chaperone HscB